MTERQLFRAERAVIEHFEEGGAGAASQQGTQLQPEDHGSSSADHVAPSQATVSPSACAQAENKPRRVAAGTTSMETAADEHGGISRRRCHDTAGHDEVSSGVFATTTASVSEDGGWPTNPADMFPTPASSRESILSEGSDREKSWSAAPLSSLASPVSFSRAVSPCSSSLSGLFSPNVVQIRRHFLAPGSSLIHAPRTCSSSCESLFSSVCPQSPPPRHRHRPPLTRLSLLTAILRKGRLPVLSPARQRPYTPCWPVSPVTLSFCNACSAASSVASIPLELSSRFPSSASVDGRSRAHRELDRAVTSPPPHPFNELKGGCPQTQVKERVKSASPPHHEQLDLAAARRLQRADVSVSRSPELKPGDTDLCAKGPAEDHLINHGSPSPKPFYAQKTSAHLRRSHVPNASLSRLQSLSQQLRSPPPSPTRPPPSRSPDATRTASPLPPSQQQNAGRCRSGSGCPLPKHAAASESFHRAHCLSPSHCTPHVYPGWPSPAGSPTPAASPAPPDRGVTPSPSPSLRSTPSPRPGSGISDCSDREGKKRKKHKIKLSYKSLAAIPTNILLLDQQAIEEQVERGDSVNRGDTVGGGVSDTHAEMCSPAQLRQQSEELYAVIDEILANSIPTSLQSSRSSTPNPGLQNNSSFPKSLGRETKYASLCSLHPPTSVERNHKDPRKTKPGVIRPMTAIPTLTVEDKEEFHPSPLRHFEAKEMLTDNKKVDARKYFCTGSKCPTLREEERNPERRGLFARFDLQITEPDDRITHAAKAASTSFRPTEGQTDVFHTHI